MSQLKEKIENDIKYLKSIGFNVVYSEKDRLLIIEKDSMLIHGLKNMLMGSRDSDSESYNILDKNFIDNYKFYSFEKTQFGFKVKSRYVEFDMRSYFGILEGMDEIDKIRTTIGSLISIHIYNNFNYIEKQEKVKNFIMSI